MFWFQIFKKCISAFKYSISVPKVRLLFSLSHWKSDGSESQTQFLFFRADSRPWPWKIRLAKELPHLHRPKVSLVRKSPNIGIVPSLLTKSFTGFCRRKWMIEEKNSRGSSKIIPPAQIDLRKFLFSLIRNVIFTSPQPFRKGAVCRSLQFWQFDCPIRLFGHFTRSASEPHIFLGYLLLSPVSLDPTVDFPITSGFWYSLFAKHSTSAQFLRPRSIWRRAEISL